MRPDTSAWTGEGEFTKTLIEALSRLDSVEMLRVEDAPASRADAGFCFISNEIYVGFRTTIRRERARWFLIPITRRVPEKAMSLAGLEAVLSLDAAVGPPDYTDDGMLQYLRTERIVPPYQTRGYKLVEMVRVYEAAAGSGAKAPPNATV